jgi:hypothetical protein
MRKEVLQATIAEIAKTACCAWEDYAKRNRGVDGPGLFASRAKEDWARAVQYVRAGEISCAIDALYAVRDSERAEKQAWHSRPAMNAIAEYEREVGLC